MQKSNLSIKKVIASGLLVVAVSSIVMSTSAQSVEASAKSRFNLDFLNKIMEKIDGNNKPNDQGQNKDHGDNKDKENKEIEQKNNIRALYGTVSSVNTNSFTMIVQAKAWVNGTSSTTTKSYIVNVTTSTNIFKTGSSTASFANININDNVLVKGTLAASSTNIINANSVHLNEMRKDFRNDNDHDNATSTATNTITTKYNVQERQDMFNKIINYFKNLLGL